MECPNYYMKGSGGFWRDNGDELPGMWEPADFIGGETDTPTAPEFYYGASVPEILKPNWDQNEAAWWRQGVRDALGDLIQGRLRGSCTEPVSYDEKNSAPLKLVAKCGCTWTPDGAAHISVCGPHRRINERNKYGNKPGKRGD